MTLFLCDECDEVVGSDNIVISSLGTNGLSFVCYVCHSRKHKDKKT